MNKRHTPHPFPLDCGKHIGPCDGETRKCRGSEAQRCWRLECVAERLARLRIPLDEDFALFARNFLEVTVPCVPSCVTFAPASGTEATWVCVKCGMVRRTGGYGRIAVGPRQMAGLKKMISEGVLSQVSGYEKTVRITDPAVVPLALLAERLTTAFEPCVVTLTEDDRVRIKFGSHFTCYFAVDRWIDYGISEDARINEVIRRVGSKMPHAIPVLNPVIEANDAYNAALKRGADQMKATADLMQIPVDDLPMLEQEDVPAHAADVGRGADDAAG